MKIKKRINIIYAVLASVALAWFAFSSTARALNPPPDGGYPGFNTAEGQKALFSLTTGVGNTALGWLSLKSNTDGSFNTGVGAGTLLFNIGNQDAGEGIENTAIGAAALLSNSTGYQNTATGAGALLSNTSIQNTANGAFALSGNTTGYYNTANGYGALTSNTTGVGNTATGYLALYQNQTGGFNTAIGYIAGGGVTTASNVICIGAAVDGANVSNTCYIGNIRGVTTGRDDAIPVVIDSFGQLGTTSSSRRFKTDIKAMDNASEAVLAVRPVTFHYKTNPKGKPQFGLVAEEVAQVNPDLVVRDEKGEIYTVRYDAVNAMLLNEFLKAHRRIEEQDKRIDQLTAQLKEQALLIQKVNDKVELNRPAKQTVAYDQ
jgi:Chaperone of endosialidase